MRTIVAFAMLALLCCPQSFGQQAAPLDGATASQQAYEAGEQERQRAITGQIGLQDYIRYRAGLADRRWLYADPPGLGGNFSPTQPTIWGTLGPTLYGDGVFEPWAVWPGYIYSYRYDNPIEQPAGNKITETGPNSYTYGPIYDRSPPDYGPVPPPRLFPQAGPTVGPVERPQPGPYSQIPDELRTAAAMFRVREYGQALSELNDVLDQNPDSGAAKLLRVQALFALAQYEEAAAELRSALAAIPEEDWGQVVRNYKLVYQSNAAFRHELRLLESHLDDNPRDAQARLLLAYQYGYLGYPRQAVDELEQADGLARDRLAARLKAVFEPQIVAPEADQPRGPRKF